MSAMAERATTTPERGAKKSSRVRGTDGRFVSWAGPGRRPTDPTLKALAAADREKNFAFIRGMRDDPKADAELRFEAAKLLAQYSDGKPSLGMVPQGPLVNLSIGAGAVAGGGSLDPIDAVVTLATQGDSMPDDQRAHLVASVFERAEAAAQRVAERRRAVVLDAAAPPLPAPAAQREAIGAEVVPAQPGAAPVAAVPGEAVMDAADLAPQTLPADVAAAREQWHGERARGER